MGDARESGSNRGGEGQIEEGLTLGDLVQTRQDYLQKLEQIRIMIEQDYGDNLRAILEWAGDAKDADLLTATSAVMADGFRGGDGSELPEEVLRTLVPDELTAEGNWQASFLALLGAGGEELEVESVEEGELGELGMDNTEDESKSERGDSEEEGSLWVSETADLQISDPEEFGDFINGLIENEFPGLEVYQDGIHAFMLSSDLALNLYEGRGLLARLLNLRQVIKGVGYDFSTWLSQKTEGHRNVLIQGKELGIEGTDGLANYSDPKELLRLMAVAEGGRATYLDFSDYLGEEQAVSVELGEWLDLARQMIARMPEGEEDLYLREADIRQLIGVDYGVANAGQTRRNRLKKYKDEKFKPVEKETITKGFKTEDDEIRGRAPRWMRMDKAAELLAWLEKEGQLDRGEIGRKVVEWREEIQGRQEADAPEDDDPGEMGEGGRLGGDEDTGQMQVENLSRRDSGPETPIPVVGRGARVVEVESDDEKLVNKILAEIVERWSGNDRRQREVMSMFFDGQKPRAVIEGREIWILEEVFAGLGEGAEQTVLRDWVMNEVLILPVDDKGRAGRVRMDDELGLLVNLRGAAHLIDKYLEGVESAGDEGESNIFNQLYEQMMDPENQLNISDQDATLLVELIEAAVISEDVNYCLRNKQNQLGISLKQFAQKLTDKSQRVFMLGLRLSSDVSWGIHAENIDDGEEYWIDVADVAKLLGVLKDKKINIEWYTVQQERDRLVAGEWQE